MKHFYWLLLLLTLPMAQVCGQQYDPLHAPNSYRSAENPNYWKNRPPFEGYWQQDVHYTIKARIDEKTDIIAGEERLEYWNNSPDELTFVFFHLYQNAFQPGSYYDNLQENNLRKQRYGRYESVAKGTEIEKLTVDGQPVKTELDNTLLKVWLPKPLKPGEKVAFNIRFKTYFDGEGNVRRRMKTFNAFGNKHYDGVHWYPRISVYDRKFGWTTDQHLGREFYGDFGTFDVELTFASNYVVGATGFLVNRDEVLPKDLRQKLDISNFARKPWNSKPSTITLYDSTQTKTWVYHAENVHDFAFTADPTYRIGESNWEGITTIALVQEPHASRWQNAAAYTADIIRVFSEDFGRYTYHKMIVADARDGMEYPMLTLDGGGDPGYRGLFVHEVGHNWFFGQVGNNETYRASLDEGFTQFLTAWGLARIDGDTMVTGIPRSAYVRKFLKPSNTRYRNVYYGYLRDAAVYKDPPLNTHSDGFHGALRHGGGYGHVYYKTATMLYNLQYVLGDELFLEAMQHYFSQWKIAHPYPEDFRNSIIRYTKADLNWFFDQWLETTKRIDYAVKKVRKGKEEDEYLITFERKGRMQMPLDFEVVGRDGKIHAFYIPNTWFEKKTDATILPRWIGWDKVQPSYEAKVTIPGGLKEVIIDPSGRLADANQLNNRSKLNVSLEFDHRVSNLPEAENYETFIRPALWYNAYDGIKTGVHLNGNYMKQLHQMEFTWWYNTGLLQDPQRADLENDFNLMSYWFKYKTPLHRINKGAGLWLDSRDLDGLTHHLFGLEQNINGGSSRFYAYFKALYRNDRFDINYLAYPNEWTADKWNNTLNVGVDHAYRYKRGRGDLQLGMRSTALGSDYDYYSLHLKVTNDNRLGKLRFRTRLFMQYGTGSNWAPESQLFLAGANPEDLMENSLTRSRTAFPEEWYGYGSEINHLHMGGGLNLRGYSGYLSPFLDPDDVTRLTYQGESGAAFNGELEFDRYIRFRPRLLRRHLRMSTYLFGDVGLINYNESFEDFAVADVRADAGLGTAITFKKKGLFKPFTIRFDMPLWINRPPAIDSENFAFRYVVGINRAF